jgi:predicted alpha/beta hydrolase family esterase
MHAPDGSGRLAGYLASALGARYQVIAPEMPDADNPRYRPWRDRLEQEIKAIDEDVIVVGHSFGGSVVLKYFAEGSLRTPVRGLFLVSVPDWGPGGWAYDEFAVPNDVSSRLPTSRVFLYHSREDPEVPFRTPPLLRAAPPWGDHPRHGWIRTLFYPRPPGACG